MYMPLCIKMGIYTVPRGLLLRVWFGAAATPAPTTAAPTTATPTTATPTTVPPTLLPSPSPTTAPVPPPAAGMRTGMVQAPVSWGTDTGVQPAHAMYMYVHRYNAGPLTGYAPSTHSVLLGELVGSRYRHRRGSSVLIDSVLTGYSAGQCVLTGYSAG